ncbi:MAG: hypothetical protein ABIO70_07435 [Pseudomonadota bacterium]
MSKMFLPPGQPLSTCTRGTCDGCDVTGKVVCHFSARKLLTFYLLAGPLLLVGGLGLVTISWVALLAWVGLYILSFGIIGVWTTCAHCPHYAEPSLRCLRCDVLWGFPKLRAPQPGPMAGWEKAAHVGCFAVFLLGPVPILLLHGPLIGGGWTAIYLSLVAGFVLGLRRLFCARCMNFTCPFNTVDEAARAVFREHNPGT